MTHLDSYINLPNYCSRTGPDVRSELRPASRPSGNRASTISTIFAEEWSSYICRKLERVLYMEPGDGSCSSRLARNMKERVRRKHMKDLLSELAFLIPLQSSKVSGPELLEQATNYIRNLQERIEEKNSQRQLLLKNTRDGDKKNTGGNPRLPLLNIRCSDTTLEINLICGFSKNFMLHEIISILQEEGAEVISASQFDAGDRLIYALKSQPISSRIGVATTRVRQRIKDLCF